MVPAAVAQTWTVNGSAMCFNYGHTSQCSGSAQIREVIGQPANFRQQYEAGYAAGQGIGTLVQSIAAAWAEHRARVNAERADDRAQLRQYGDAALVLLKEDFGIQATTLSLYDDLRQVDPTHSSVYDEGTAIARKMQDIETKLIEQTPKNIATIAQAKDLKFLRQNVETNRKLYDTIYHSVQRSYIWAQLLQAQDVQLRGGSPGIKTAALQLESASDQPRTASQSASSGGTPPRGDVFFWPDEPAPGPGAALFEVVMTAHAYDGVLDMLRQARKGDTSTQDGKTVLETNYHPATVNLTSWQKSNPRSAPALFYWQDEQVDGATSVMYFQMTKRAYEQILALAAGSKLRIRPPETGNQNR
jgi:hypothetical protein